jgi:hypothetical protein
MLRVLLIKPYAGGREDLLSGPFQGDLIGDFED